MAAENGRFSPVVMKDVEGGCDCGRVSWAQRDRPNKVARPTRAAPRGSRKAKTAEEALAFAGKGKGAREEFKGR